MAAAVLMCNSKALSLYLGPHSWQRFVILLSRVCWNQRGVCAHYFANIFEQNALVITKANMKQIYVHRLHVYYHYSTCSGTTFTKIFFFYYQFEPIYGTPYQKTNVSSGLVDYWKTDDDDKTTSLYLPGTNQFFPKDLNVLEAPENVSKIPVEISIDSKYDHRLQENSATSIIPLFHPRQSWCFAVVVAGHRVSRASCLPAL